MCQKYSALLDDLHDAPHLFYFMNISCRNPFLALKWTLIEMLFDGSRLSHLGYFQCFELTISLFSSAVMIKISILCLFIWTTCNLRRSKSIRAHKKIEHLHASVEQWRKPCLQRPNRRVEHEVRTKKVINYLIICHQWMNRFSLNKTKQRKKLGALRWSSAYVFLFVFLTAAIWMNFFYRVVLDKKQKIQHTCWLG